MLGDQNIALRRRSCGQNGRGDSILRFLRYRSAELRSKPSVEKFWGSLFRINRRFILRFCDCRIAQRLLQEPLTILEEF